MCLFCEQKVKLCIHACLQGLSIGDLPYDLHIIHTHTSIYKKVFASKGRIDSFNKNTCQFEAFRERTTIIRVYIIIIDGLKKKIFTYVNNNNEKNCYKEVY